MKTPHTQTRRGKTCRVELRDGEVFIGKFLEKSKGHWLTFEGGRRIHAREIKVMSDKKAKQEISKHRRVGK